MIIGEPHQFGLTYRVRRHGQSGKSPPLQLARFVLEKMPSENVLASHREKTTLPKSFGAWNWGSSVLLADDWLNFIHGMVIQGTSGGNHYGAASVGAPDENDKENCRKLGVRVGKLVKKLHD